jgi:hypothetical protein
MKKKINLETLKSQFDKVMLKHERGEGGKGGRTTATLVKGGDCFGGTAFCFANDQFNRVRGRQIALGRALHAYNVFASGKHPRVRRPGSTSSFYGRITFAADNYEKPTILIERVV